MFLECIVERAITAMVVVKSTELEMGTTLEAAVLEVEVDEFKCMPMPIGYSLRVTALNHKSVIPYQINKER